MKYFIKNNWEKISLGFILLLGLILRLIPAIRIEFWLDEALTFSFRHIPFFKLFDYEPVHPPLFYFIIGAWSYINTSPIFLRIVPISFSLLSTILVFMIGKLIKKGSFFTLVSSFLFAVAFFQIDFSYQLRMYSMVLFFILASSYSLLKIALGKNKWLWVFVVLNFLGYLTDYCFLWYFISLGFSTIFMIFFKKIKGQINLNKIYLGLLLSSLLMIPEAIIMFINLKRIFVYHIGWVMKPDLNELLRTVFYLFSFDSEYVKDWRQYLFSLLVFLTLFSCLILLKRSYFKKKAIGFLFWTLVLFIFFVPLIISFVLSNILMASIFLDRQLIVVSLMPVFGLGALISFLIQKKKIIFKVFATALLMFVTYLSIKCLFSRHIGFSTTTRWDGPSWKNSATIMSGIINYEKDKIMFAPPWLKYNFDYYFYEYDKGNKTSKFNYSYLEAESDSVLSKKVSLIGNSTYKRFFWLVNPEIDWFKNNIQDNKILDCIKKPLGGKNVTIFKCYY